MRSFLTATLAGVMLLLSGVAFGEIRAADTAPPIQNADVVACEECDSIRFNIVGMSAGYLYSHGFAPSPVVTVTSTGSITTTALCTNGQVC